MARSLNNEVIASKYMLDSGMYCFVEVVKPLVFPVRKDLSTPIYRLHVKGFDANQKPSEVLVRFYIDDFLSSAIAG